MPASTVARSARRSTDRLSVLRSRIDELDVGLLQLIEQRGLVVEEILALKRLEGLPVLDEARERELIERLRRMHRGPHDWHAVERVFRLVLEISRGLATRE